MFQNLLLHLVYLRCKCIRTILVTFREDNGKRNLTLTEFDKEVHVDLAYVVSGIYQNEEHDHLFRKVDVVSDYLFQFLLARCGHFCITVAGKVDKIPLSVDEEVIYESGLAWLTGCHRKLLVAAQHIDQR